MTLLDAIKAKDPAAARAALAADPAAARGAAADGTSLLCLAVYYGQPEIADAIAAAKPDVDVFEAAALGRVDRLRAVLDEDPARLNSVAADGFFPLGLAAYFKHPDAARLLLDRGADPNQAASNGAKVTALHAAVSSNQPQIVEWLLDAGADVNARQQMDYTPLMGAAANARTAILDLLLARGADPALRTTDGKSAADLAREHGHEEVAARLGG
jgi:ankyrin repeat protein